jgi:hypothetical protein
MPGNRRPHHESSDNVRLLRHKWSTVSSTLKRVGMAYYEPDLHRKAFEDSDTVIFVCDSDQLVGFGWTISDDAYQV